MTDEIEAKATPLLELARRVPEDLRAEWPSQWHDDGTPCGHTMAPVGRYIHQMADYIEQLDKDVNGLMELLLKDRQRIEQLEAQVHLAFYEGFDTSRIDPDIAWDESNAKAALPTEGRE